MCLRGVSIFPTAVSVLMIGCVLITYLTSVLDHHVYPLFPYISDTGVKMPESCLFSEFINLAAICAITTLYIRYRIIKAVANPEDARVRKLKIIGLIIAMFSCFGLTLVANFQETKKASVRWVHLTGAGLVFGLGVVYQFIDSIISYRLHPNYNNLMICHIRLFFAFVGLISFVITAVTGVVANMERNGDKTKWSSTDKGYGSHLTSTICEWFNAFSFILYFFTYVKEFSKVSIGVDIVVQTPNFQYDIIDENQPLLT